MSGQANYIRRAVVAAALVGGAAAFVVMTGFVMTNHVWGLGGAILVAVGGIALLFGPLVLQVRAGLSALRAQASSVPGVLAVTAGFCAAATMVFGAAFLALYVGYHAAGEDADLQLSDLPSGAVFFVPWVWALVSGSGAVAVAELTQWVRDRRA